MPIIYALEDPRSPGIYHYVGCTRTSLPHRLAGHLGGARSGEDGTPKGKWLRSLLLGGVRPRMVPLDEVAESEWATEEVSWTTMLIEAGHPVKNTERAGRDGTPIVKGQQAYRIVVPLSPAEVAAIDSIRNGVGRGRYLRALVLSALSSPKP